MANIRICFSKLTNRMLDELCGLIRSFDGETEDDDSSIKSVGNDLSPFDAHGNDYSWPDLYSEMDEMFESCILIYPFAQLRQSAREGKVADPPGGISKLPLTHSQVIEVVEANRDEILRRKLGRFYFEILKAAASRGMITDYEPGEKIQPTRVSPASIVAFDDEFESEELVCMVDVNHVRKRVTLCFRGSLTRANWAEDTEIYMKDVENPVRGYVGQDPAFCVHHGLYEYLFNNVSGPNGESFSQYTKIMREHVVPVLKEHTGYKLYVTGHSMGGALATLFGFKAAAEPDSEIPKPVSVFSFGSPYVGDQSFRSAHQLLEGLGKLRHLRVLNHEDLITGIPKISMRWQVFDSEAHVGKFFKHVGMCVRLFEGDQAFEISYPKVGTGTLLSALDEFTRAWDQAAFSNMIWNPIKLSGMKLHQVPEYNKRIVNNKPSLSALYLNDLYSRRDIVGKLIPGF